MMGVAGRNNCLVFASCVVMSFSFVRNIAWNIVADRVPRIRPFQTKYAHESEVAVDGCGGGGSGHVLLVVDQMYGRQ